MAHNQQITGLSVKNPPRKPLLDKKIIYFSRFHNNPDSHGGDKRAAQICEMLSEINYEFVSMYTMPLPYTEKQQQRLNKPSGLLQRKLALRQKQRVTCGKYQKWSPRIRDFIFEFHTRAQVFVDTLKNNQPSLLIIDDPVFLAPLVKYANSRNVPLVAVCHNLETLSRAQVEPSCQQEMLYYELELLAKCDLVITISKEETWLLKNLGMNPAYLPYFPLQQNLARFQEVRRKREEREKANYLLFGTVYNFPTLDGMKQVIAAVTVGTLLHGDRLFVAGFGTDQLASELNHPAVELRGAVTDAELDELLITIKGCIVYQESGSGALTKIPELLVAGVPVIINSQAARSHHNLPGLFEFAALEQLSSQLTAASQVVSFTQVLSPPDTTALTKRILGLVT